MLLIGLNHLPTSDELPYSDHTPVNQAATRIWPWKRVAAVELTLK
jgi:hypothetical protein